MAKCATISDYLKSVELRETNRNTFIFHTEMQNEWNAFLFK